MSWLYLVLVLVALQRMFELFQAQRNTDRLLARGASEIAPHQHPFFVAFHAAWLVAMAVSIPAGTPPNWWLIGAYALVECGRIWTIASLGEYWTTRIITLPSEPLVQRGPYRFVRHPNYIIVVLEVAILPLAFDAWQIAMVASVINAALLVWRMRAENAALNLRRGLL